MVGGARRRGLLFVVVELRSREPLIPLSLFRNRTFTLSVIASIATGIAMFGASVFLSQYMQLARGATPTEAGPHDDPDDRRAAARLRRRRRAHHPVRHAGRRSWSSARSHSSPASFLLSTIHYDTDFTLVSVYMFLLGAGVGMTMQNLVLVVQNTTSPAQIGVASSGVTFFRSLGGTIGVSVMGAALATRVTDAGRPTHASRLTAAVAGLGDQAQYWAEQLQSGTLPQVSAMPETLRVIFEDIYAQGHLALVPHRGAVRGDQPHRDRLPAEHAADPHDDQRAPRGRRGGPGDRLGARQGMASLTATGSVPDCGCRRRPAPTGVTMTGAATTERPSTRSSGPHRGGAGARVGVQRAHQSLPPHHHGEREPRQPGDAARGAYKVFTTIVRRESITASALTEHLLMDKGQLSRTVRELEQLGLIERRPDPDDGRSSLLSADSRTGWSDSPSRARRRRASSSTPSSSGTSRTSAISPGCCTR